MNKQLLVLHLGSNIGNRLSHIRLAEEAIETIIGPIHKKSAYYETEPWGNEDQPHFINSALSLWSHLKPISLLHIVKQIEYRIGRKHHIKWSPRIIDIDIILYGDMSFSSPLITLPHPHLHKRKFVLMPLVEIISDFQHPRLHKSIISLFQECQDTLECYPYTPEQ